MTSRQRFLIGLALAAAATVAGARLRTPLVEAAALAPSPAKGQALARVACLTCHKVPAPDILPRAAWAREIEKMALILAGKGMPEWGDTTPRVALSDEYQAILAYYEAAAPVALPRLPAWPAPDDRPLRFVRRTITFKDALTPEPAVANVRLADLDGDGRPELLACDMRQGVVLQGAAGPARGWGGRDRAGSPSRPRLRRGLRRRRRQGPARRGPRRVLSRRPREGRGDLAARAARRRLRAASPSAASRAWPTRRPSDAAGGGKPDIVVAAFGWHAKGEIALLRNRTLDGASPPSSARSSTPARAPSTSCPPTSTATARLDLVALIAQEHEAVVAFLGDGKGGFAPRADALRRARIRTGDRRASRSWTSTRTATSTCS